MNRKQLALLIALVVVIGGAGLYLRRQQSDSYTASSAAIGGKLLGKLAVNDVVRLVVKQGTNELSLAKTDEIWRVRERGNYPANFSEIKEFLLKAQDLKIVQQEAVGPSQLPKLWLAPGTGSNTPVIIEFRDKADKVLATLLLGKKHTQKSNRPSPFGDMGGDEGFSDGRYVKVGTDSGSVSLINDALESIRPQPDQWLNKDFVKIEKPKAITVTFSAATNSWKLEKETEAGEWKMADTKAGEQTDSGKISGVTGSFNSLNFSDVATDPVPATLGLDHPTLAAVETFDGFTYNLKIGSKTNDHYALTIAVAAQIAPTRTEGKDEKPEDKVKLDKEFTEKKSKLEEKLAEEKALEKWTFLVSTWPIDALLKERAQLMAEKKETPPPASEAKPGEPAPVISNPVPVPAPPPPPAEPKP